jgi:hypothetical protein
MTEFTATGALPEIQLEFDTHFVREEDFLD